MLELSRSTAGHYRHPHRLADPAGDLQIKSSFRAIGIDAIEHDLAGTQFDRALRPADRLQPSRLPAAMREHFPFFRPYLLGIDAHNNTLAAKLLRSSADQFRVRQGR